MTFYNFFYIGNDIEYYGYVWTDFKLYHYTFSGGRVFGKKFENSMHFLESLVVSFLNRRCGSCLSNS